MRFLVITAPNIAGGDGIGTSFLGCASSVLLSFLMEELKVFAIFYKITNYLLI